MSTILVYSEKEAVTEITVPGRAVTLDELPAGEVVTLISQTLGGDLKTIANAAAASAAAAHQSELNASNSEILIVAEDLFAGALVNIYDIGVPAVRLADASLGYQASGYVLVDALANDNVRVYFDANNTSVVGLVPGRQFLSTIPGRCLDTPPTTIGHIVQRVGFASRATNLNFQTSEPITLA